jgi:hypothetical protein
VLSTGLGTPASCTGEHLSLGAQSVRPHGSAGGVPVAQRAASRGRASRPGCRTPSSALRRATCCSTASCWRRRSAPAWPPPAWRPCSHAPRRSRRCAPAHNPARPPATPADSLRLLCPCCGTLYQQERSLATSGSPVRRLLRRRRRRWRRLPWPSPTCATWRGLPRAASAGGPTGMAARVGRVPVARPVMCPAEALDMLPTRPGHVGVHGGLTTP